MAKDSGALLPRGRAARWLVGLGGDVPAPIRGALMRSLYGTLPIYVGGVVNTITVAAVLSVRLGTVPILVLATLELILAALRLHVLVACRRAMRTGRSAPADAYVLLSLLWALGVGAASFIAVASGDWLAAITASVSAAAMLGGICFRYFAAPRLVCAMLLGVGIPGALACIASGELLLLVAGLQIPIYIFAMTSAAWKMNRMMVAALCAEREQAERPRRDALTGLLNRLGLAEAVAPLGRRPLAAFFIDLDGFKRVNDTLGHAAGDALLAAVAARLRESAGPEDVLARLGGDEFLLVAPCADAEVARQRGETLVGAVAGLPYIVDAQGVLIGASIGVALAPDGAADFDALLDDADAALYRAKALGDGRCVVAGTVSPDHRAAREAPAWPLAANA